MKKAPGLGAFPVAGGERGIRINAMFSSGAASLGRLAKSCHCVHASTDYESKENIVGMRQSQARQAQLIAHTVREFGKSRRFWQNIPWQEF